MKLFKFLNRVIIHILAVMALISGGMTLQAILQELQPERVAKFYTRD